MHLELRYLPQFKMDALPASGISRVFFWLVVLKGLVTLAKYFIMLDFNQTLKGLDGVAVQDIDGKEVAVGKLLASQLASSNKGDALKLFTWAQKLYAGEHLDLDPSDSATLKSFIKDNEQLTVLAKAQLLMVFKD